MTKEERELMDEKFRSLTTLINAQFIGVNDRLDKTNGKLSKHDNEIRIIQDTLLSQRAIKKYLTGMFIAGLSIGGLMISLLSLIL